MDRSEQLTTLAGAAAGQWGLVTAAQAKKLGLNAVQLLRLTEAGLLENVGRAVYLLPAAGIPEYLDLKVAWLRLQPQEFAWDRTPGSPDSGVISHASAAQLHGLGDIPAPNAEITVPRRRTTTERFVRLRTAPLEQSDITVIEGLPVTTVTRTIVDLLRAGTDGGHIGGVIADAEHRDLINVGDLADAVQSFPRNYGLSGSTTGQELIEHLVSQAGEHLRADEVARASREGFETAVQLLARHPELATPVLAKIREDFELGMASNLAKVQEIFKSLPETMPQRVLPDISPALTRSLQDLQISNPAFETLQQKLREIQVPLPQLPKAMPDIALPRSIQQAASASLSPTTPKPLPEADTTSTTAARRRKRRYRRRSPAVSAAETSHSRLHAEDLDDPAKIRRGNHEPE